MAARLSCFLYEKSAHSFLAESEFPGLGMDSVPSGFSQLPQVRGCSVLTACVQFNAFRL